MNKIFYDGKWFAFVAPDEQYHACEQLPDHDCVMCAGYKQAYAEARAKALPVLNSEIIQKGSGIKVELNLSKYEPKTDIDYDWPGEMKLKIILQGYVLSLPSAKDESKMNTAEDWFIEKQQSILDLYDLARVTRQLGMNLDIEWHTSSGKPKWKVKVSHPSINDVKYVSFGSLSAAIKEVYDKLPHSYKDI
jgi:hypothetical protein